MLANLPDSIVVEAVAAASDSFRRRSYWMTLDYRQGANPSVAWIDVDNGEDVQIAPSFEALLNGLVPSDEFDED